MTAPVAENLPVDPTAYRPAEVMAGRDSRVGQELEPLARVLTLDKSRLYQGWPANRNRHTDYAAAQLTGLREPNINGGQTAELIGAAYVRFFGESLLGGSLSVSFLGFVNLDDEVIVRGRVTGREEREDGVLLSIELVATTQDGRTVAAGKGTGLLR